jgi:hypothetical protein
MADTQEAPQLPESAPGEPGSISQAQNALLGLLSSEEEPPKEQEEQPSEEASTEEPEDEPLEEAEEELEASDEGEEEDSEESEEEVEEEEPDLYAVTIDGAEHEVTFDELIKGYSRQSDYTKKTQALAELRNSFEEAKSRYETELPELQGLKEQYVRNLGEVIEGSLGGLERFNIDWNALREEDQSEYLLKREEFRQAQEHIQGLQHRKQQEETQLQQQMSEQHKTFVASEHEKLAQNIPEWREAKTRTELGAQIREYALSQGFVPEEIDSLVDSRSFIALMKAMKYDALSGSNIKAKKVKNKPRVVKSGSGATKKRAATERNAASMKRLRESGRVDDAAKLFEDFVDI